MKLVVVALLFASCYAGIMADINAVLRGMGEGLRTSKDPDDQCWRATCCLDTDRTNIENDIDAISDSLVTLKTHFESMENLLPIFWDNCDVPVFLADLADLLNPILFIQRYEANSKAINANLKHIADCLAHTSDCNWEDFGDWWGQIIRLMTTWSV